MKTNTHITGKSSVINISTMKVFILMAAIAGSISAGSQAQAAEVSVSDIKCSDEYTVRAKGNGVRSLKYQNPAQAKLMAREAAIADGYRNLGGMLDNMRVTGKVVTKEGETDVSQNILSIDTTLSGVKIANETYYDEGIYEVIVEKCLVPESHDVVLSDVAYVEEVKPVAPVQDAMPQFTSFIIDARGTRFQPKYYSRIVFPDGSPVWNSDLALGCSNCEVMPVLLVRTMSEALSTSKAGDKPLVIKAAGADGKRKRNIVVSQEDAFRMIELDKRFGIRANQALIILVD